MTVPPFRIYTVYRVVRKLVRKVLVRIEYRISRSPVLTKCTKKLLGVDRTPGI
jgi:hypothetical protein